MSPTALIAEDEPLLAQALCSELQRSWPALSLLPVVADGHSAVQAALRARPQVLFLDIRMPGQSGLEAAADIAEHWPPGLPFPALVFVTAYDQYAVQAFEAQAIDYLLKPVRPERLERTLERIRQHLDRPAVTGHPEAGEQQLHALLGRLHQLLEPGGTALPATASPGAEPLRLITASVGATVRVVPVEQVLAFEAADKYVRVLTADAELLLRTPLKDLLPRLNPDEFWQIHRGTVVRAQAIAEAVRGDNGKLSLRLRGRPERWPVSRLHEHRLRPL
ncbi:LytTR family DNA-binding domain-containing protein [Hydrogenophaga sp. IBVHS2]|uniref:LytR/AlgR family response regulator transcription factor n=1 Tax=Hydrogenophaga sp. IBVHS2 TaxID=1985170 RepID=UPI000A2D7870|nr:LytTR family DNA-binding domain-containing protein [Hydrogenophaga sp. IBVHS2]OSZ65665.1 DNA-binding response regulator [Hydrogenophaga sp. IBVHS2]